MPFIRREENKKGLTGSTPVRPFTLCRVIFVIHSYSKMKIFVKVKPNAKEARVKQIDETHFEVWVKEPPVDGRANEAVVRALAAHFGVAPARVIILSGYGSRQKVVEVA